MLIVSSGNGGPMWPRTTGLRNNCEPRGSVGVNYPEEQAQEPELHCGFSHFPCFEAGLR